MIEGLMIAHILPCHIEAELLVVLGYIFAYGRDLLSAWMAR